MVRQLKMSGFNQIEYQNSYKKEKYDLMSIMFLKGKRDMDIERASK